MPDQVPMGQCGISFKGLEKGILLILWVILMWVCLKAGLQPGLKFIKPPISNLDDREGSGLLVSWPSRWFLAPSASEEAGKECGCVCLNGGWEVSPTSLNPGTRVNRVACQGPQRRHRVFKHPRLMIRFLSFNRKCRGRQEGGTGVQSSAVPPPVTWSAPQGPSGPCHTPGPVLMEVLRRQHKMSNI